MRYYKLSFGSERLDSFEVKDFYIRSHSAITLDETEFQRDCQKPGSHINISLNLEEITSELYKEATSVPQKAKK